jgi:hypothetical protein
MIGPDAPGYRERGIGLLLAALLVGAGWRLGGLPRYAVGLAATALAAMVAAYLMDERRWSERARRRALMVTFLAASVGLLLR